MRGVAIIIVLATLAGCSEFPELDDAVSPEMDQADYPALVPVEPLIAAAQGAQITEETGASVLGRVAALKAKAAGLSGTIVDEASRKRMQIGVPPIDES
ncbi:hypothetical protein [Marimonas lutisalis]|uniref:hypothetical protein n=1 Tax=Marimonas lutisalis TaxID=2545756 RepID=UPI0010F5B24F|nr:hypothetical protein [Marimonas lutisalis]